ncbi:LuxR C-terminal-related transcriptional regulator [Lentzea sp. NPDC034063]|uniref:ATP-binding protein n=1 Tax=unclassified Lentzea TaxID=2643253 RepID=UPI0033D807B4
MDFFAAADLEAVRLFADRAAASAPGFVVNADNWKQVVQLCRALDGSPLAIELAAAWLRILPLEDVVDRMRDRFSLLLQGNNKFAPIRQRSLLASVTWTYELCVAAEKLLWKRLAVFVGTFDLAAAEVVCGGDGLDRAEIAPTLARLVEKSVVSVVDGYYRLSETSREYGLHHLRASGEYRRLAMRHCEYFTRLAGHEERRWRQGRDQAGALARVRDERSNIFAALEFCSSEESQRANGLRLAVSLHFYWLSSHSEVVEGSRWLSYVLAQNPEPGSDRALGLVLAAALTAGQAAAGPASLREAQGWALVNGDDDLLGLVWLVLAVTLSLQGRLIQALGLAVAANECFEATGDLASNLLALSLISEIQTWVGSITAAISTAERALHAQVCRNDDVWAQSYLLLARGTAFARNGDLDNAEADLLRGLHIAHRFGDLRSAAQITERLAWTASDSGSHVWAAELLGVSARIRRDLGTTPVFDIAPIARLRGRYVQRIMHRLGETDYASAFERGVVHEDGIEHALRRGSSQPRRHGGRTAAATPLTGRERQVARLVAKGLTNREVANRLGMAQRTAETHVDRILRKLQLTSRTQLARWLPTSEGD